VDLEKLLDRLAGRGVERLLLEGGGELNWAFVRDDLVDELCVTIVPTLLGGRDAPTLLEGDGFSMELQRRLRLESVRRVADELFCRYSFIRRDP
jgi:2,5-diamino-6-(ribosylamino)-4(3H)-pyrimidinone 5'-phosphate reductase